MCEWCGGRALNKAYYHNEPQAVLTLARSISPRTAEGPQSEDAGEWQKTLLLFSKQVSCGAGDGGGGRGRGQKLQGMRADVQDTCCLKRVIQYYCNTYFYLKDKMYLWL